MHGLYSHCTCFKLTSCDIDSEITIAQAVKTRVDSKIISSEAINQKQYSIRGQLFCQAGVYCYLAPHPNNARAIVGGSVTKQVCNVGSCFE